VTNRFTAEDMDDLRGKHVCCDYTCTFDGTMRRAAAEIERLQAFIQGCSACKEEWARLKALEGK
jgi:hypothetical protein